MRVFLDTNVLVAAFATRGLCADLFQALISGHEAVVSAAVLAELRRALSGKISFPAAQVERTCEFIADACAVGAPGKPISHRALTEPDRRVLGDALHAGAEVFVTGDQAILAIARMATMDILAPRALWERLKVR